jgi:hypothetical protein
MQLNGAHQLLVYINDINIVGKSIQLKVKHRSCISHKSGDRSRSKYWSCLMNTTQDITVYIVLINNPFKVGKFETFWKTLNK